jgi:hypothetical protein
MNPIIETVPKSFMRGFVKVFSVAPDGSKHLLKALENLYVYTGADVVAAALGGRPGFSVGTMYMEFENLAAPGDPIIPPSYDRSSTVSYYSNLTSPRDFLRVPLTLQPTIISSDESKYDGNQITFFGISSGSVGENGLAFSHTVNSTVFGGGLCASPVVDTQANDRLISRTYWASDAVLKQQNHQIGVQWTLRFL